MGRLTTGMLVLVGLIASVTATQSLDKKSGDPSPLSNLRFLTPRE
jgi:hypothetical protein